MTEEQVEKTLNDFESKAKDPAAFLVGAIIFAGKDKECPACPLFIKRLRASPKLAQKIKEIMQNWKD
jgi:hypothetical protein